MAEARGTGNPYAEEAWTLEGRIEDAEKDETARRIAAIAQIEAVLAIAWEIRQLREQLADLLRFAGAQSRGQ